MSILTGPPSWPSSAWVARSITDTKLILVNACELYMLSLLAVRFSVCGVTKTALSIMGHGTIHHYTLRCPALTPAVQRIALADQQCLNLCLLLAAKFPDWTVTRMALSIMGQDTIHHVTS
eukprot:TRINITY_DN647_c0_g2_i1.p1 TRINITY_DN647_c0_g2~~TRINITY_DN647_c0_g2_i1.p1  ORF type:complete len:120 (+),score=8.09 TRINITY_DN647_c0_g2_i1:361-720(+)